MRSKSKSTLRAEPTSESKGRRRRATVLGASAGLGLCLALLPVAPAHAVTVVPCGNIAALRAAITASNTSNEAIALAPSCTYTLTDTVSASNGLPNVTGTFTISGYNTTIRRSPAAGTLNFRLFEVASGGKLTLNSIHVVNGHVSTGDSGGAIRVSDPGSSLTVQSGSVRENRAGFGGGIRSRSGASVTLNSTAVIGNEADESGGGVSHAGSTLTLNATTVQDNTAGAEGGGLRTTSPARATLMASRVIGNTANGPLGGGGIYEGSGSQVSLFFATVTGNTPDQCRPTGAVPGCTG